MSETSTRIYIDAPTLDNSDQSYFIKDEDFKFVKAGEGDSSAKFPLYEKFLLNKWRWSLDSSGIARKTFKPGKWNITDANNVNDGGDFIAGNTVQVHGSNFIVGKLKSLRFRLYNKNQIITNGGTPAELTLIEYSSIPKVYILESEGPDQYKLVAICSRDSMAQEENKNVYVLDRDYYFTAKKLANNNFRIVFIFAPENSGITIDSNRTYSFNALREYSNSDQKRVGLASVPRGALDTKSYICHSGSSTGVMIKCGQNRLLDFYYQIDNDLIEEFLGDGSNNHHLNSLDTEELNLLKYSAPVIKTVGYNEKSTAATYVYISHESLSRNNVFNIIGSKINSIQIPFTAYSDKSRYENGETMYNNKFNGNDGLWHTNRVIWIYQPTTKPTSSTLSKPSGAINTQNGWIKADNIISFSYFDTPNIYHSSFENKEGFTYNGNGLWIACLAPSGESGHNTLATHYYQTGNSYYQYNELDKIYSTAREDGFNATANIKVIFNYGLRGDWFDYIESLIINHIS